MINTNLVKGNNNFKVMIAYPPLNSGKGTPMLGQNRQFRWFKTYTCIIPLVPASAATLLKEKGYNIIWKDAIAEELKDEEFYKFFKENKPDLIAIETKTPIIKTHWKIINQLKEINPKTKIVLMGDHVTVLPKESFENSKVDYVLTGGDYDFMLLSLCEYLTKNKKLCGGFFYRHNGKLVNSGDLKQENDLNSLPFIDRELVNWKLYKEYNIPKRPYAYIISGRDCPYHRCKFCAWPILFPKFRVRNVENVLDEIGMLIGNYKIKSIFDDTGTFPTGKWLEEFCKGMISRGYNKKIEFSCNMRVDYLNEENAKLMKEAGFKLLKVGLESANQKTLDRLDKGIKVEQIENACRIAKKFKLNIQLTVMVGYPWETKKDIENTYNLAKKLMQSGNVILQSTVIVPYPGTGLYKEAVKNKWFRIDPFDYEKYDMSEPVLITVDATPEEILKYCKKVYSIYLTPKYIFKRLISIRSLNDLSYILKGFKAVIGHLKYFSS